LVNHEVHQEKHKEHKIPFFERGMEFLPKNNSTRVLDMGTFIIFANRFIRMERIVAKSTLRTYWEKHPETEQYLKTWYDTAMSSNWKTPNEVIKTYASASILKDSRIVFNIKGNAHRLIAKFNFEKQWIFIRFVGTHAEYDKVDANTI
jgi:mRNA interferase HigB